MSDRENGFLTDRDKAFLRSNANGDDYYTGENAKNQRYETREVIAERARQAFHDFALLYDTLDQHERDRIFDVADDVTDHDAVNDFHSALVDTVAFLYLSLEGEAGTDTVLHRERSFQVPFDAILTQGVKRGEISRYEKERLNNMVNVEFGVDVTEGTDYLRTQRAVDKIARSRFSELTEEEMYSLLFLYDLDVMNGGYARLEEQVAEKREELGITPVEPSDELLEQFEPNDEHDAADK